MFKRSVSRFLVAAILVTGLLAALVPQSALAASHVIYGNNSFGIYIDIDNSIYTSFAQNGYGPYTTVGCGWFASARARELTGTGSTTWNGQGWWNGGAGRYGFATGTTLDRGQRALVCWSGHISVIEGFTSDGRIIVSEGGVSHKPGVVTAGNGYCWITSFSSESALKKESSSAFLGYVYLGSVSPQPVDLIFDVYSDTAATMGVYETDATVGHTLRISGAPITAVTEVGIKLYNADTMQLLGHKEEVPKSKNGVINVWYEINKELGVTLTPGQNYKAVFHATVSSAYGGKTFTCDDSFRTPGGILITNIALSSTSCKATIGTTKTLTATISPSNASNKRLTWSSSDINVVEVNDSGTLTPRSVGRATITCAATDGSGVTATCVVSVLYQPGKPTISVSASDSMHETVVTWAATSNTTSYQVKLFDGSGTLLTTRAISPMSASPQAYPLLLPAGSYQLMVNSLYGYDGYTNITSSDRANFSVASASVSGAGTQVAQAPYNGKLYCVYNRDCTWLEAESLASQAGGSLVSITSAAEQQHVASLISNLDYYLWIGAEKYRNGLYTWVTGEAMNYTNWKPSEPNNTNGRENCVQILPSGLWNDCACTSTMLADWVSHGYIAEFDALSMDCFLAKTTFTQGNLPTASDLSVTATFANGSLYEVSDFTVSYSGTGLGAQTMTIKWGSMSKTYDITIVEAMGTPDFTLPASLTAIESEAFMGLKMSVVKCPEGLEEIGARAFANCANLREIYIPAETLTISASAFSGCSDLTIWGESGSVAEAFAKARGFTFKVYAG